jgi:pilus assembly protein FimV
VRDNVLKLGLLAVVMSLLDPCGAYAAGLGRLMLFSTLGQALNAEVELLSVQRGETITAKFAAPEVYQEAGVQYNNALTGGRVTVEKRPNGQLYLKVTTPRPIAEPFIELLIEINSENGRVVRQYTALLDPPGYGRAAGEIPPPAAAPPSTRAPAAAAAEGPPVATPAPPPPAIAATPAAPSVPPAQRPAAAGAKSYGPIKPGETLGRIARSVRPEGVSVEQTLIGLYRHNPDAFINKNINLVKSGKILRVPETEELAAVPHRQAAQELRLQVTNFESYSRRVAERPGAAPEAGGAASGRVAARVAEPVGEAPRDTVRVSRGEPDAKAKGAAKTGASTADRVRTLEEEALAREKALADANARIAQLETIIKDSQRAVELKSSGSAAAQKGADKASPPAERPSVVAVAPPPAVQPPQPSAVDKGMPPDAPKAAPPLAEAAKGPDAASYAALPKPEPAPVSKAERPASPVAPPASEPSFLDTLMSEPAYLVGAAGGVLLLAALLMMMARRRRATDHATDPNERLVKIAPSLGSSRAAAALPLGAAATAAAAPSPSKDAASPEPLAAATEEVPSPWPLQSPASPSMRPSMPVADDDLDFHAGTPPIPEKPAEVERDMPLKPYTPDYERPEERASDTILRAAEQIAKYEQPVAPEPARPVQPALQRTESRPMEPLMPDFALETPVPGMAVAREARSPTVQDGMEFDLEPLPPIEAPMNAEQVSSEPPASLDFKLDLADFDIDASAPAENVVRDDHWYDVQQKFDLAKAYEEMGDKDGARDILQEVVSEGDPQQQAQANKLLASLG